MSEWRSARPPLAKMRGWPSGRRGSSWNRPHTCEDDAYLSPFQVSSLPTRRDSTDSCESRPRPSLNGEIPSQLEWSSQVLELDSSFGTPQVLGSILPARPERGEGLAEVALQRRDPAGLVGLGGLGGATQGVIGLWAMHPTDVMGCGRRTLRV